MKPKDRPRLRVSLGSLLLGFKVGVHKPKALGDYILFGKGASVQGQANGLAVALGWDILGLSSYWQRIKANTKLKDYIEAKLSGVNYGQVAIPELLYVLVRKLCPKTVVETGVAAGVSSAYILQALEDNEYGRLYSIDYPNYAMGEGQPIPKGMETGFAVPNYLLRRWNLQIGKSETMLPAVLAVTQHVDIFLHDSEHSYDNMLREYMAAWVYLKEGGLLVSHDINETSAFREFAQIVNCKGHEIYFTNMGVIRK